MDKLVKCKDCIFWVQEVRKDKKPVGQCKVDGPQMGPNGYGFWPITGSNEGCFRGEQKTKPMLTESEIEKMTDNTPPPKPPEPPEPPPTRVISEDI